MILMKDKRLLALRNSNALYDEIFVNQNICFRRNDSICYCLEETLTYYSNLVTVDEEWKPDEIFEAIDKNFERENWSEWSIKDSFAVLNLTEYKFETLFSAQWFYLEAEKFTPLKSESNLSFAILENESDLEIWRKAWDDNEKLGKEIFDSKLLNNPRVYFIAGYENNKIACGCFLNKSDSVLGVSNFFAKDTSIYYWSEIIEFIFSAVEKTDIVGYEQNALVEKLEKRLNFEKVGDLTIWIKNRNF